MDVEVHEWLTAPKEFFNYFAPVMKEGNIDVNRVLFSVQDKKKINVRKQILSN